MNLKNINTAAVWLVVALIIYILYLTYSTTPVPNRINETGVYYYDESSNVPPTYVTNEMAGLGIILVLLLFFSTKVKEISGERITERKWKEILTKELRNKQNNPLPDSSYELKNWKFKIDINYLSKSITEGGKRKLNKYISQVTFTDDYDVEHYYLAIGDPYTGMIDGLVPTDEKLTYKDKCPDCGRYPDEKFILPEEFKTLKEIKNLTL